MNDVSSKMYAVEWNPVKKVGIVHSRSRTGIRNKMIIRTPEELDIVLRLMRGLPVQFDITTRDISLEAGLSGTPVTWQPSIS